MSSPQKEQLVNYLVTSLCCSLILLFSFLEQYIFIIPAVLAPIIELHTLVILLLMFIISPRIIAVIGIVICCLFQILIAPKTSIISPVQFILDYLIPYLSIPISILVCWPFFKKIHKINENFFQNNQQENLGLVIKKITLCLLPILILSFTIGFLGHLISGMYYFAQMANSLLAKFLYSFWVNIISTITTFVLCCVSGPILINRLFKTFNFVFGKAKNKKSFKF